MVCKLCLQNKPLADSHIIPKFAGKWLKETSATGYLRTAENPNVRKQDLPTEKLLCYDCEGLLSLWEKAFANEVFLPFLENKKNEIQVGKKSETTKIFSEYRPTMRAADRPIWSIFHSSSVPNGGAAHTVALAGGD